MDLAAPTFLRFKSHSVVNNHLTACTNTTTPFHLKGSKLYQLIILKTLNQKHSLQASRTHYGRGKSHNPGWSQARSACEVGQWGRSGGYGAKRVEVVVRVLVRDEGTEVNAPEVEMEEGGIEIVDEGAMEVDEVDAEVDEDEMEVDEVQMEVDED
ncbi:hypothetical protein BDY19DRAFT_998892 [Irpex rosettiformis]|uniref:Uncharacterized protein n=1 Tax=Irpex rosettiformis TaxID=378272 RepID=A0ACB8TM21_9APHY|nr:hypothetical protein BDY19DRAFT_998892 [Irpex rosettiformis]